MRHYEPDMSRFATALYHASCGAAPTSLQQPLRERQDSVNAPEGQPLLLPPLLAQRRRRLYGFEALVHGIEQPHGRAAVGAPGCSVLELIVYCVTEPMP